MLGMSKTSEFVQWDLICRRYWQTLSFSQAVICRFTNNVSKMKKLAARDYEDLLQCSIPAFENLLNKWHNKQLMKLLYWIAEWHALVKSRMHTDTMLEHLRHLTKEFSSLIWQFRDQTCSHFNTVKLPHKVAAWNRLQQDGQAKILSRGQTLSASSHKLRKINLSTIKFHSLGDYAQTIQQFGCTDSFSTQLVWHLFLCCWINSDANLEQGELAHCLIKQLYGWSNKCDATRQIAQCMRWLEQAQLAANRHRLKMQSETQGVSIEENMDPSQYLEKQYHMSNSQNDPVNLYSYIHKNQADPAFKPFIPKLKDHILGRLLEQDYKGDMYGKFTNAEWNTVHIASEQIYCCKTVQINYTTYDIRHNRDTINIQLYLDIMVNSLETGPNAQPY